MEESNLRDSSAASDNRSTPVSNSGSHYSKGHALVNFQHLNKLRLLQMDKANRIFLEPAAGSHYDYPGSNETCRRDLISADCIDLRGVGTNCFYTMISQPIKVDEDRLTKEELNSDGTIDTEAVTEQKTTEERALNISYKNDRSSPSDTQKSICKANAKEIGIKFVKPVTETTSESGQTLNTNVETIEELQEIPDIVLRKRFDIAPDSWTKFDGISRRISQYFIMVVSTSASNSLNRSAWKTENVKVPQQTNNQTVKCGADLPDCCLKQVSINNSPNSQCWRPGIHRLCTEQILTSDLPHGCSAQSDFVQASDRIEARLQVLRSELVAMRETDLALLQQLVGISLKIHQIQRTNTRQVTRSNSFSSQPKDRQCYRPDWRPYSELHDSSERLGSLSEARTST